MRNCGMHPFKENPNLSVCNKMEMFSHQKLRDHQKDCFYAPAIFNAGRGGGGGGI